MRGRSATQLSVVREAAQSSAMRLAGEGPCHALKHQRQDSPLLNYHRASADVPQFTTLPRMPTPSQALHLCPSLKTLVKKFATTRVRKLYTDSLLSLYLTSVSRWIVRDTVHKRSCDCFTDRVAALLAASPSAPSGNRTVKDTSIPSR